MESSVFKVRIVKNNFTQHAVWTKNPFFKDEVKITVLDEGDSFKVERVGLDNRSSHSRKHKSPITRQYNFNYQEGFYKNIISYFLKVGDYILNEEDSDEDTLYFDWQCLP